MKGLVAVLVLLLLVLQYRLWFSEGSIQDVHRLRAEAAQSRADVLELSKRNQALAAEVGDLKRGLEAIEERARADLGMISKGETFYQFVLEAGKGGSTSDDANLSPEPAAPESQTTPGNGSINEQ